MNESLPDNEFSRPRPSFGPLLLVVGSAFLYASLAVAAARSSGSLLQLLIGELALTGVAWIGLTLVGASMLVVGLPRAERRGLRPMTWPVAGVASAAAHVVAFVATISVDPFAIFAGAYISTVFTFSALLMIAVAGFRKRLGDLAQIGFAAWIAGLTLAHLWVIAGVSASV